jgi:hypothetical protein
MAFERAFTHDERVAYATLHHIKASGELIGSYRDQPIYETVTDEFGRRYTYLGLAPRLRSGKFDPDALAAGEFILMPGLLYVLEELPKSALRAKLGGFVPETHRHHGRGSH